MQKIKCRVFQNVHRLCLSELFSLTQSDSVCCLTDSSILTRFETSRFAPPQGDCALLKRQNAELRLGFEAEEGRLRRAFNIELDEALAAARAAEEARAKAVVEVQYSAAASERWQSHHNIIIYSPSWYFAQPNTYT